MYRFVIADNRKCIGCYACVAACTESHRRAGLQAYPRLFITHTSNGTASTGTTPMVTMPIGTMPIQCRHCEDAMCALVCPVHAITYAGDAIRLNESLCIGCKMCALACPYGNILPGGTPLPGQTLTQANYAFLNTPLEPDPMFLREINYHEQLSLLAWKIGQKSVAVKCDLCYFRPQGPACVEACPHRALVLMDDETQVSEEMVARIKEVAEVI